MINLPNTDVRQLTNSMRTMITDQNTQQMLPAGATNSMVLTGFGSDVVALARMLLIVDEASRITEITPVFEVVRLEFADAEEVSSLVEELLQAQRGRPNQAARGATGAAQSETEPRIMVDERTNSLLVMSMPDEMPYIKDLVAQLDVEIVERERSYHIYNLENVQAEELAGVLNDFLDDASRVESQATPGNPQARTNRNAGSDFVVVADEATNSLLIAASRTRYEELLALIQRLDRRQHQVLIETALIELTTTDMFDIGVELGFARVPGAGDQDGFGVTNFGLSTFQDTDADGLVDSRIPNLATGITAGILDGDDFSLPALISLVETKQNSNVLNVPSVLVNNNGQATVEALERQPTTTITTGGGGVNGQTQENFNDYQDAGITMEISPSISASNYLRLNLYLQVSTFQGSFTGSIPPPQLERTLQTTVNVPDGDTMVIGGIVVDNRSDTRSQIPWVGNLPLIGSLFRRDTNSQSRTALYFFVTPHILEDVDFADLAELSYRKKVEAADQISRKRMQKIDPNFGRKKHGGPVDLESFDVPLYSKPMRGEVDGSRVGLDPVQVHSAMLRTTDPAQQATEIEASATAPQSMDNELRILPDEPQTEESDRR